MTSNDPIDIAIEVAAKAHRDQVRKGTDIPYISHPYAVGLLLSKAGYSDEQVIAGILHDTVEDTKMTLNDIHEQFGEEIATIVKGCSEPDKSLSWEERKRHTIEFLKTATMETLMVSCADKLHNIRAMASDFKHMGDEVWNRFRRGKKEQAWYYQGLAKSIASRFPEQDYPPLVQEFLDEVHILFNSK